MGFHITNSYKKHWKTKTGWNMENIHKFNIYLYIYIFFCIYLKKWSLCFVSPLSSSLIPSCHSVSPAPWFSESGFAPSPLATLSRKAWTPSLGDNTATTVSAWTEGKQLVSWMRCSKHRSSGNTVDGKNPKQPPGMYKTGIKMDKVPTSTG